jgi:hypothetical protein
MLYQKLADIHGQLAWALLELRGCSDAGRRAKALGHADAALDRLNVIVAVIAEVKAEDESREIHRAH